MGTISKPAQLPRWADVVGAEVTDPPSGKKDTGWVDAEKPPHDYFNWLLLRIYQWLQFVDSPKGTGTTPAFDVNGDTGDAARFTAGGALGTAALKATASSNSNGLRATSANAAAIWAGSSGASTFHSEAVSPGTLIDGDFWWDGTNFLGRTGGASRRLDNLLPTEQVVALRHRTPPDYLSGLGIARTSNTQITVYPGTAMDATDTDPIRLTSPTVCDINVTGANGRDAGAVATGWWFIWVISQAGGASPATLMSLSATAPTMPGGYTLRRRVGACRYDSGLARFLNFRQLGASLTGPASRRDYWFWEEPTTTLRALSGGAATAFTPVSLAALVPSTASSAYLQAQLQAGAAARSLYLRPNGHPTATIGIFNQGSNGQATDGTWERCALPLGGSTSIDYRITNATGTTAFIDVLGFEDVL